MTPFFTAFGDTLPNPHTRYESFRSYLTFFPHPNFYTFPSIVTHSSFRQTCSIAIPRLPSSFPSSFLTVVAVAVRPLLRLSQRTRSTALLLTCKGSTSLILQLPLHVHHLHSFMFWKLVSSSSLAVAVIYLV